MSFDQIRGQHRAIELIKGYLRQDAFCAGYLFTGPESVGKKMAAINLAKALNCLSPGSVPCDSCPSCRKIDKGAHPDVLIIAEGTEEIKIEKVRELQRLASYRPYEGRKKVFIIDNAHRLTAEASNALLKILEEPPKDSILVLVSDKPGLLFKTVISRCKIIRFSAFPRQELEAILKKEHRLADEAAHFLSFYCEGKIGRALAAKDMTLVSRKNAVIDWFIFAKKNSLHQASSSKEDIRDHLAVLSTWFRDIYAVKSGLPEDQIINFDRRQELVEAAQELSYVQLNAAMDFISTAMLRLEQNVNIKLLLNTMESQLCKG